MRDCVICQAPIASNRTKCALLDPAECKACFAPICRDCLIDNKAIGCSNPNCAKRVLCEKCKHTIDEDPHCLGCYTAILRASRAFHDAAVQREQHTQPTTSDGRMQGKMPTEVMTPGRTAREIPGPSTLGSKDLAIRLASDEFVGMMARDLGGAA